MKTPCSVCDYDLSQLPVRLRFEARTAEADRSLRCPLCGGTAIVTLMDWGVFPRTTSSGKEYCTWRAEGTTAPQQAMGGSLLRPNGTRMSLLFDVLNDLDPQQICHSFVPTFAQEGGTIAFPSLPVRAEYFDCIDLKKVRDRIASNRESVSEIEGKHLVCRLPLRGLPVGRETISVKVPVHGLDRAAAASLGGLNLRVWPTPLPGWRHYLVGLASSTEEGDATMRTGKLRVRFRTPEGSWQTASSSQRAGCAIAGASEGLPEWVAVEVLAPGGSNEPIAGGAFWVPPPPPRGSAVGELKLGLDFGTSNTCIAYEDPQTQNVRLLPALEERRQSLYLVRGGTEASRHAGPDFWPAPRGVGPIKDLFPSEILTPRPIAEMTAAAGTVADWQFGIDYGIPGPGVESASPAYHERQHVLSDFKWKAMVERAHPAFAKQTAALQERYLEAALMQALTRIVLGGQPAPATVTVTYSYPMAFIADDKTLLDGSVSGACKNLTRLTGVGFSPNPGVDESRAAAAHAQKEVPLAIYVDMGGGTTDIGAIWSPMTATGGTSRVLFSTSVQYAGSALLDGFAGKEGQAASSCLTSTGKDDLKRRVREADRMNDLRADSRLFQTTFAKITENRTRHFYYYVVEYVARMIAAALIEGIATVDEKFLPETKVVVYLLGNGWGFFEFVAPNPYETLVYELEHRVRALLEGEPAAQQVHDAAGVTPRQVRLEFVDGKIKDLPHRKAAVATGVLKALRNKEHSGSVGGAIGLVGWTTRVNEGLAGTIPWYRRYDARPEGGYATLFERRTAGAPTPQDASPPLTGEVEARIGGQAYRGHVIEAKNGTVTIRVPIPKERVKAGTLLLASLRPKPGESDGDLFDDLAGAAAGGGADLFSDLAGVPSVASIGPGTPVETDTSGGRRLEGLCRSVEGENATVEWHAMIVPVPQQDVRSLGQSISVPAAPVGTPSWGTELPPRLVPGNMILSWKDEPPSVGDGSIRGPFELDPELQSSLGKMRQGQSYDRGWLTRGAYELMLEIVFKENLWKIGAG